MPEKKAPKNLQYRPSDDLYRRFTVGRKVLDISNDAKMIEYCIEFTLCHIAENIDEHISDRRRALEEELRAMERSAQELREILAS